MRSSRPNLSCNHASCLEIRPSVGSHALLLSCRLSKAQNNGAYTIYLGRRPLFWVMTLKVQAYVFMQNVGCLKTRPRLPRPPGATRSERGARLRRPSSSTGLGCRGARFWDRRACVYLSVRLSVCQSLCLSVCLSVRACVCVCVYACMYACMHACMHTCM